MVADKTQLGLRIEEDLRGYLEQAAKRNKRSLNSEIEARLAQSRSDEVLASRFPEAEPLRQMVDTAKSIRNLAASLELSARMAAGEEVELPASDDENP